MTQVIEGKKLEKPLNEHSLSVPLMIALVAFVGFLGVQSVELTQGRFSLEKTIAGQQQAVNESARLRRQLNLLAGKTAGLAEQGNDDAKGIVAAFSKMGVHLSSPSHQAAPK